MQLHTGKQVWAGRLIGWVIAAAVSCTVIGISTFMLGPMLFSNSWVSNRVALTVYCPGAVSSIENDGASTPTTSPSGTYGHTVEITCTFADESTKIIRNEEYAFASIGGMFGLGALCGFGISIPIVLAPFFLFRRKKAE